MKKKIVSVILCAAMATTVLAGCGSSNTASTDAAAEETTEDVEAEATKEEAEDAEAAEGATDAAEVTTVEPGVLTMGTNATFPPYEYKDGDDVVGIDAEIAQAMADKLGLQLEIVDMDFDSLVASVQSGKIDMSLAGMTVTEERKQNVDFTDSYATGVQVIIVKEDSDIASADDLEGKLIGVQQGTTGDILSSDQVEKDSQMKRYPKGSTAIQALKNGKIDCVVIDSEPAAKFGEKNQDLKIIDGVFETEEYAMCVKKGNTELLDEMNKALEELKEDGTVDKIIGNYIGDDTGKYQYESPADVDHSKGTLVMATNAEFEPYEYHEGDGIVGIDVDLSRAICDKMGYDLEILDMEFDSILPSIAAGKADFGAAGMTVDAERQKNADFTDTYANASQVVIVRK